MVLRSERKLVGAAGVYQAIMFPFVVICGHGLLEEELHISTEYGEH
jgi:hypothetical protein